jgi:hypothetical protein
MTTPRYRLLPALALVLPAALAACGGGDSFPPSCPKLSLLSDAADLTRYSPRGTDITDLVLDGRITSVPATCERGSRNTIKTTLKVNVDLSRGPAAQSRNAAVPVFVAVMDGDTLADKQNYVLTGVFSPNVDTMKVSSDDIVLNIPVSPQKSADGYKVYVGFTLTPDELALNRKRGPR